MKNTQQEDGRLVESPSIKRVQYSPMPIATTDTESLDGSRRSSAASSVWEQLTPLPQRPDNEFPITPMLQKYPSFVPLRRHATSLASVAFLVPGEGSALRKATVTAAVFNMTATIIGGGVLSIPLSCARAGLVPFMALMVISAVMTDFSLYLLCSCTRRCGSMSYGTVARKAVGPGLELFTTAVIFFLVGFIVVGLMVLNQGIWTPIVMTSISKARGETPEPTTMLQDAIVLFFLLVVMLPNLLKRDLTSLRHICYVGFFSIAILCVAMAYRAVEKNVTYPGLFQEEVTWATSSFADVLNGLPIILLAFLCSFNIISVHCSLIDPTKDRVKDVIHRAVFLSFLVMFLFGLAGYLYAYDETDGNILLNFDPSDDVILIGRIGCGITTLFALPMNLLPCREALLSLIMQMSERRMKTNSREQRRLLADRKDSEAPSETSSIGSLKKSHSIPLSSESEANGYDSIPRTDLEDSLPLRSFPPQQNQAFSRSEQAVHWAATFAIVTICFIAAVLAPGVAIVWDIAGSSMAFLIQFIIPAVCYIRLKSKIRRRLTKKVMLAWALLVFASFGALLCTAQTIWRMLYK